MAMEQSGERRAGRAVNWDFWLLWVLASAVGGAIGLAGPLEVGKVLARRLGYRGPHALGGYIRKKTGAPHATRHLMDGMVYGTAQWLLLRQYFPHAGRWVFATALGWFLGGLIPHKDTPRDGAIQGVASGAMAGLMQWLLLLRKVPQASRWVLNSTVGTFLGWVPGFAVAQSNFWLGNFVAGAITGALTGVGLLNLLPEAQDTDQA